MLEKRPLKKSVMEEEESSKRSSSSEFYDVFEVNFSGPLPKVKKRSQVISWSFRNGNNVRFNI